MSTVVCRDITLSGFIAYEEKRLWVPLQLGEFLGFILDLQHGIFQVAARKVKAFKGLIDTIIDNHFIVSARCHSHLSGSLVSMGLALGPVFSLWTQSIYRDICQANYWDKPFLVSQFSCSEVLFWRDNFDSSRYPIWSRSPKIDVLTYSEAGAEG